MVNKCDAGARHEVHASGGDGDRFVPRFSHATERCHAEKDTGSSDEIGLKSIRGAEPKTRVGTQVTAIGLKAAKEVTRRTGLR
jgi:hypothetical protein